MSIIADSDSIGFLGFDVGILDDQITDLTRQLEAVRKAAQADLDKNKLTLDLELGKGFQDADKAAAPLSKTLQDLTRDSKTAGDALTNAGKGAANSAAGVARVKKEVDPLQKAILGLSRETLAYRSVVESTDVSNRDAVANFTRLKTESLKLATGLDRTTAEYKSLVGTAATASRSIKTLSSETTRLGFSGNTTVGVLGSMRKGFGGLGSVISPLVGAAGIAGLVKVTGDFVGEAQRAQSAASLFEKNIDRFGVSADSANGLVEKLSTQFGVLPASIQGSASLLLKAGGSLEDIEKILTSAGASAAASGTDISNAFENVAQGAAQGRSELFETAGIVSNVSDLYKTYAKSIGVSTGELTQSQKVQAIANGVFEESKYEIQDLDSVLTDQVKSQQAFRTVLAESRQELGAKFAPALTVGTNAVTGLVSGFGELPGTAQASAAGLGVMATSAVGLSGALGVLKVASAALFSPPTGIILAGIAVAAGLGVAIYTAGQKHEDAAEKVSRLTTEAENIVPALDGIKTATSKQQLLGNIETLAETMDGDAKTAFVSYAQTAVDSAKTTGEAVIGIMQGIAVARKSILEDAVRAQASLLKDLERNQQESQTGFNIATATGGTGRESSAITRLQSDLAKARTLVTESEQAITKAVAAGYSIRETYFRQQLEQDKALVTQIIGEIGNEIENTPAGRLNYDTSQAEQATRDLRGLQGQLDELNQLVETGTSEQIEAYFSRGAEGALKLSGATGDAEAAFAGLKTQLDSLSTLDATGAETLLASLQSLKETYPELRAALNPLIVETQNYIKGLGDAIPVTDSATSSTRSLSDSFETVTGDANDFSTAIARLSIDPVAEAAAQAALDLETLGETIRAGQRDLALSKDGAEAWGKVYETVFGASGRAATEADTLERKFFTARRQRQNDDIAAQESLADAVAYYSREVESSYDPLDAQIKQNKTNITVLGDVIKAQSDWNEHMALAGDTAEQAAHGTEFYNESLEKAAKALGDATKAAQENADAAQDLSDKFDSDGIDAFTKNLAKADLIKFAGDAKTVGEAFQDLSENGIVPTAAHLEVLTEGFGDNIKSAEYLKARGESLAEVTDKLGNASSLTALDLEVLRAKLEAAADDGDDAAIMAQNLLVQLDLIGDNKLAGFVLGELGQLATDALTNVKGLGQDGQIALGAFSGAATAAGAALEDGMLSTADGFNIVSGLIDGVVSQLGDDVPAETKIAGSAISGVFSGAAAGAQFGPWGIVAGGIIGGISGLFDGITAEQQKQIEKQQQITEELQKSKDAAADFLRTADQGNISSGTDLLQKKLDYEKKDTPEGKKGKKEGAKEDIAQARIDLIALDEEYQSLTDEAKNRLTSINSQIDALQARIDSGELTGKPLAEARKTLGNLETARGETQAEINNYASMYAYDVQDILDNAGEAAKSLGLTNQQLYEAILTGNDEILGALTPEQRSSILKGLQVYYNEFGVLPAGAAEAAAALGLSTDGLMAALSTSDTSLGTAAANGTTATRQGVADLNQQLVDFFGPEKSAKIRAMILGLYNDQAAALGQGDQTLATTATGADAGPAALGGILDAVTAQFGDKAGPIIDLINQTYAGMGGAVETSTTTLGTQATGSSTTVSGDLGGIFTSAQDAITATAPGATSALTSALSGLKTGLGDKADPLSAAMLKQEQALAERNKQLFLEQQIMAGKHGPEAKAALENQIEAERKALQAALYSSGNGGGLVGYLGTSETNVSGALGSFFSKQDTTLTTQGGQTVDKIGNVASDIREAMNKLIAASTVRKLAGNLLGPGGGGSGGGGGGRPGAAGFFAPLNATIDDRVLGGMSSEFGNLDMDGLMQDIEARPFGYGTSFAQSEPDRSYGGRTGNAGPLTGLLLNIRKGVEVYKKGVVGSVNSAITTQQKAFSALSRSYAQDVQTDTERTLSALREVDRKQTAYLKRYGRGKVTANKEQKKAYAENKKLLLEFEQDTFDLISGRALTGYNIKGHKDGFLDGLLGPLLGGKVNLIKGFTDQQQGILDFAKNIGTSLEQSVSGGISQGLKTAIKSGEALDFKQTLEGLFDTTFDGLFDQLSKQVLAQSLGPLLTDLTADITKGDVTGAAKDVSQIADKLPGIFNKLEQILAPLRGTAAKLGLNTPAPETQYENLGQSIRLEARSLGSATPDWLTRMGSYFDAFGRHADLIGRAAELNMRAAREFSEAVKGTKTLESRNPQRLSKI